MARAAQNLARRFRAALPARAVLDDPEQTRAFESDSFPLYRKRPLLVLLPESESQVAAAVKICAETRTPLVARGAGTGLSGGALPHEKGVLLSTSKMNRVLRIDPVAATARVEPGARNLAVSEAAAPFDLFYAPDPSSQAACSIGGNVAENSGGVRCLKYGLTGHNLLGLRFVCADGEIAEIGHQAGECAGYDLLPILTGSEGLLGIVTEITLRLRPRPAAARVALAAFASARAAGDAVSQIVAAGIVPSGLEMMDQGAVRAVEEFVGAGYPQDAAAILLFEVDGGEDEVAREMARGESIARAAGAIEFRIAKDEAERELFWRGRKAAFPAAGRIKSDYYCMDGTIPRRRLGETLEKIAALARAKSLVCVNVFHAGDGNLHPLICFDGASDDETRRALEMGEEIMRLCVAAGGSITGEHGVGVEKLDGMCGQFTDDELSMFHDLKTAFDEFGLLNPGKAVPTLNRCAEFGFMRGGGGGSRDDLPRF